MVCLLEGRVIAIALAGPKLGGPSECSAQIFALTTRSSASSSNKNNTHTHTELSLAFSLAPCERRRRTTTTTERKILRQSF